MSIKEDLRDRIHALREQLDEVERAENQAVNAAYMGRCFRYRNCYSCPETDADYWWLYRKVVATDDGRTVTTLDFETDKNGDQFIRAGYFYPDRAGGDQEISLLEYEDAAADFEARVAKRFAAMKATP